MKPGRNDPCTCGSGRKYKKCCGQESQTAPSPNGPHTSRPPTTSDNRSSGQSADLSEFARLIQQGRYLELEQAASRLVGEHPSSGIGWNLLGVAQWQLGKDAMAALEKAAALLPEDPETHSNLGNALRRRGLFAEAVASHRRALALRPGNAAYHNNLGAALFDLGEHEAAIASYGEALKLQPNFALASVNLGHALRGQGLAEQAVDCYRRALAINPDLAEAHNDLGNALLESGQPVQAVASYERAIALRPDLAGAHSNLGSALRDLGHLDMAIDSYQRALALRPNSAELLNNLSIAFRLSHRHQEAEASAREAHLISPTLAAPLVSLSKLKADLGEFAQAEELLGRALALDPDSSEACSALPKLRKMTSNDASWLANARAMSSRPRPARELAHLHFAMGKYYDDIREYTEAFDHYRRGNELKRSCSSRYDAEQHARLVSQIIERCNGQWLGAQAAGGITTSRAVLIIGMPRSGTSLVEQILASHPEIFGAGELTFWSQALVRWLSDTPAASDQPQLRDLAERYLTLLSDRCSAARCVIDKMPANYLGLGLIHAALPNARIIHVQRHPIDTCLSIYFQDFESAYPYANDLRDLAHHYTQYVRLMSHWRSVLPAGTLMEISYEQLVTDQESWTRELLDYLGVDWDPACLEFQRTQRPVITASNWQVRQKLGPSSIARWHNYRDHIGPLLRLTAPPDASS